MKKVLLILALLSPVLGYSQDKKKGPKTFDLIVGSYTSGKSKGISVYRFYAETGRLAYLNEVEVSNPSYLCVSNDNKYVYAVSENDDSEVSAYGFDPKSGQLTFINKQKTNGASACFVSIDEDNKNIFTANYSSGNVTVLPLAKDGSIQPVTQTIQGKGTGVDKSRQEGPHAHMSALTPDGKYLFYTDLGTDKLNLFRYHSSDKTPLTPASPESVSVTAGSGPRHFDFSPDKKHMYLIQEMTANVTVFDYNGGKLKQTQSITMLADGFKGGVGAADIHVSPDGKFLYVSNRGEANDIVVYSIAPETGMLTFVARTSTYGKGPRNFVIDPTGSFLLVANQNSDNIITFKIDKATGKLNVFGAPVNTGNPVCLKFASATAAK
ncbi:lactonase family protein [Mucilaginibacter gynuensis]|uniref:Lactonase family protein n=1 Tax=Mucilaginibacter gynuensis TaxID=1302236 RepID=A0ABP8GB04_9SPHI